MDEHLKNVFLSTLLAGAVALSASVASAQDPAPIVNEDFESYTDHATLSAVWGDGGAYPQYILMTDGGHSGQNYVRTDKANNPTGRFGVAINLTASDASPIELSYWTRFDSAAALGRSYSQLEAPGAHLVNFGQHNSPAGAFWKFRVNGGGLSAWTNSSAPLNATTANVWQHHKVVVESRRARFYVDGVQVGEATRTTADFPTFTNLRFGYTVSSSTTVDYDDITLKQVSSVNDWNLY